MSGVLRNAGARRRVVAGAATLAATAMVLSACGGGGGGGNNEADGGTGESAEGVQLECSQESAADAQFKAAEPVELGILWTDWPEMPVKDSWQLFDEIEARTNVRLVPTHVPFSDRVEKQSLLISAGDAPPLIPLIYTGDEKQFAASQAVLPLSDYSEYMPNFNKYVDEWDLREMVNNLRQDDGKYYMTPGLQEVSVPVFSVIIRKDIFEEVGAEVPNTWEELRTALEKIKAAYPDSYPLGDGFEGASMLNYAAHAFGTVAGWGFGNGTFYNTDTDEFEYAPTTEGYHEMVEYFHGLAADGLLDIESFTQSNDGAGTVKEKVANSKIFAASGAPGTVNEFAIAAAEVPGAEGAEFIQIAPPGGPAGDVVEPRGFWHGFMLTSQVKDDPNLCTYLQFADWLYYNPEARELIQWGVEGETYTKEDGVFTLLPEFKLEAYNLNMDTGTIDIAKDLGWASNVFAGSTESRELKESYNSAEFVDYMDSVLSSRTPRDHFPPAPLNEMELEQASLISTALKDTVDTATMQFIVGQRDLSEWDTFVSELEGQNLQTYLDLVNGAADRYAEAVSDS
ncbi:extracellular solute-binding protein [Miniimonas sp. S16]|uniref:ABC transporter substrate-binding protein n=1 Tax=Miniimonas sp. S16 TaxID=2171623 RepID=UPI000D5286E7|nr:extracellular solute-binding protein [Miniimonas sp. S16]